MIPFTFPTYVQGDGTIACRAKVITDTTGLVRWIDYTPIKFVASMTNMGTTNNDGSQAIELITQTTGLVKGIDYIVVYVDSSATVPWSTNANGYIPCYSAPYSLFASSEQGVWYDPSDFSTLFQDSAGTTPVTAVEQPVGLMLDKSGRGNHATQATAASRPILKQDGNGKYYLLFDGVDDGMATGSIDFTATDKMTVVAGVRKLSDAVGVILTELSATWVANTGTFLITTPSANGASDFGSAARGTAGADTAQVAVATGYAAPITSVLSSTNDIAGDLTTLRVNKVAATNATGDKGAGNYGNYPLYIGARAGTSLFFNGHLYSLIIRGAQSSAAQITSAETYVNGKTGAY